MLYAVAAIISLQDPERAIALAEGLEDERSRNGLFGAIAANIASKDPKRALELLSRTDKQSSHYYRSIFQSWMKSDPTAAMAAVKNVKGQQARQQAQQGIAVALAKENPEKAWAYADALGGVTGNNALGQVMLQMVSEDPQQALTFFERLPNGQKKERVLGQFVAGWMNQDPEAAKDWIKGLPENEKVKALSGGVWYLTQSDLKGTIQMIESLKPSSQTASLYANLVNNWAQSDPDAALKWVKQLPLGSARQSAESSLLSTLSRNDPAKAMEFLKDERVTDQNRHRVTEVAAALAQDDPDAAFAWLDSLEVEGSGQKELINNTIRQLAYQDSEKAASYVLSLEDPSTRKDAIANLIGGWGSQDREAAQAWIVAHLDPAEQLEAYNSLLGTISYQDPLAAKGLLEEASQGLTPEEIKKHFGGKAGQIAGSWARNDPAAAVAWVQSQPDNDERYKMTANVVDQWAEYDSTGAANFVLTLTEGKERDSAIKSLVDDLRRWEPESAFLWANSISDDNQRKGQIRRAVNSWKRIRPSGGARSGAQRRRPRGSPDQHAQGLGFRIELETEKRKVGPKNTESKISAQFSLRKTV